MERCESDTKNTAYEDEFEYIDVVWLKRDVRWTDHGPISEVARTASRKFVILYLYEPDQLKEPTVHGSHVRFVHEGLLDMEKKLCEASLADNSSPTTNHEENPESFQYITVCHNTIISTLNSIHFRYLGSSSSCMRGYQYPKTIKRKFYKISRLLAHEETGHWQSYMRDRSVRKWCKTRSIPFVEFNQTGVTRRLKNRDDYLKLWKAFMTKPLHPKPDLSLFQARLILLDRLPGFLSCENGISKVFEGEPKTGILENLPAANRCDRPKRQQFGGETKAMGTLRTFLSERGATYSQGISSPNSSWNSCSRLSPYLTWGHISLRTVLKSLEERRDNLRQQKARGRDIGSLWLKSLQAFASRAHWRSHFVQKLESEPTLEKVDLCPAYQHLRREEGDWDHGKYLAWESGKTGYPFVDACMRSLIEHGWINFRMRAMLVSFATYNLWLDWKKIAPHLARVFLDFEPGIHYPQLQMQAGTTGINAMRVYNVTKQGKDQDPKGIFIRKYVPELKNVPDQYIHEPWKMSEATKAKYYNNKTMFSIEEENDSDEKNRYYPEPIVDEKESARISKEKLNAVKKSMTTRILANEVYVKHGSRSRQSNESNGRVSGSGALPAAVVTQCLQQKNESSGYQPKIKDAFVVATTAIATKKRMNRKGNSVVDLTSAKTRASSFKRSLLKSQRENPNSCKRLKSSSTSHREPSEKKESLAGFVSASILHPKGSWNCTSCTFLNEKPHGLVCTICGTQR